MLGVHHLIDLLNRTEPLLSYPFLIWFPSPSALLFRSSRFTRFSIPLLVLHARSSFSNDTFFVSSITIHSSFKRECLPATGFEPPTPDVVRHIQFYVTNKPTRPRRPSTLQPLAWFKAWLKGLRELTIYLMDLGFGWAEDGAQAHKDTNTIKVEVGEYQPWVLTKLNKQSVRE